MRMVANYSTGRPVRDQRDSGGVRVARWIVNYENRSGGSSYPRSRILQSLAMDSVSYERERLKEAS